MTSTTDGEMSLGLFEDFDGVGDIFGIVGFEYTFWWDCTGLGPGI